MTEKDELIHLVLRQARRRERPWDTGKFIGGVIAIGVIIAFVANWIGWLLK